jgi:hypothetical protein
MLGRGASKRLAARAGEGIPGAARHAIMPTVSALKCSAFLPAQVLFVQLGCQLHLQLLL